MTLRKWLRRVGLSVSPDDEAAEREELGLQDSGEADLERARLSTRFAGAEGAEAAADDLDELRPPRDPNP